MNVDDILSGLTDLVYTGGLWLAEDDKEDFLNPKAHPGIHHWMIGVGMMWAAQLAYAADALAAQRHLLQPSSPPTVAAQDSLHEILQHVETL